MHSKVITIALSKGRIFKETMPLLKAAGIEALDDPETSRKLILDTNQDRVKVVLIRATDVPTYVQWGAADLGVAGKDTLIEHGGEGLYEPLDLQIARCRLMVAGKPEASLEGQRLRIATKYVRATKQHFAAKGQQVEIIKLYGSMELAPLVGLADRIVDLVDTGNTLRANNLVEVEHIADISSWLIANSAAMKLKHERMQETVAAIRQALEQRDADA